MPRSKRKSIPAPIAPPQRLHLDRRAGQLAIVEGDDDDLLTTAELAAWLAISVQWCEIARHRGFGPPYIRVAPGTIRYRRGAVREWLCERQHLRTSEYRHKSRKAKAAQAGAGAP